MKKKIFIDGSAGTTGLKIRERLMERPELELIALPGEKRKDPAARAAALNAADLAFLCLPDDAAREAVSLLTDPDTVLVDTSTAHRTAPDWAYGFPELGRAFEDRVRASKRIAVPGCHAGGFIALVRPLVEAGLLAPDTPLACFSLTGFSGGGKKMIAEYDAAERSPLLDSPRVYGLGQVHKHLPEMQTYALLSSPPVFLPTVGDYFAGMETAVPLHRSQLVPGYGVKDVKDLLRARYAGPVVLYTDEADEAGFTAANRYAWTDRMEISVHGNDERFFLCARFDNLGKGASGAAVECMDLALGFEKTAGLVL